MAPSVSPLHLQKLQRHPRQIRNLCVLAHVDHGKTTLTDSLLASNGVISQRQAGKMRYLDSRPDEQLRGITMKSSAISLLFDHQDAHVSTTSTASTSTLASTPASTHTDIPLYLINLIDSPGHVDFSGEVSTAVRLSDACLVVVDVVEGVCPQTHAVIKQAWIEMLQPCLVLNKVDRLITELHLSPTDAYSHIQRVVERVNAVSGTLYAEARGGWSDATNMHKDKKDNVDIAPTMKLEDGVFDWSVDDVDDSSLYFAPERGNVVFASAGDGWAFGINDFAVMLAKKLGVSAQTLRKVLWGDFYYNSKIKRFFRQAASHGKKPLFVQMVMENLWAVYQATLIEPDAARTEQIVKRLGLKGVKMSGKPTRVTLQTILQAWLPLSKAVLSMVVERLPSPLDMTRERAVQLLCGTRPMESFSTETLGLLDGITRAQREDGIETVAFVSKMVAADRCNIIQVHQHQQPQSQLHKTLTPEELKRRQDAARAKYLEIHAQDCSNINNNSTSIERDEIFSLAKIDPPEPKSSDNAIDHLFIGYARIYSGCVYIGQKLYVLGPKYDSCGDRSAHVTSVVIDELYLIMGDGLVAVDKVPAGNIAGIGGLAAHVLKTATLSSTLSCASFSALHLPAAALVRVAVEPESPLQISELREGLRLLSQSDPCVEVSVMETGEHVLAAAGEVHLEVCLKDLRERFARVEFRVSAPIVPFRETIISSSNKIIGTPEPVAAVGNAYGNEVSGDMFTSVSGNIGEPLMKTLEMIGEPDLQLLDCLGTVEVATPGGGCRIRVRAKPLPARILNYFEEHAAILKTVSGNEDNKDDDRKNDNNVKTAKDLFKHMNGVLAAEDAEDAKDGLPNREWSLLFHQLMAIGSGRSASNILVNTVPGYARPSLCSLPTDDTCLEVEGRMDMELTNKLDTLANSIITGFHLAIQKGPLAAEPVMGVCFQLVSVTLSEDSDISVHPGQVMSAAREAFRFALLAQPCRLMMAMYSCDIQATTDVLGKVYAVLAKHRGRVLSEEMKEGTDLFMIRSSLPVWDSFGFADNIRKKASGAAAPQLLFSHWETLPDDPFIVLDEDEQPDDNLGRRYMNDIRRRKGLRVHEKTVEHAEKQRTLAKKK